MTQQQPPAQETELWQRRLAAHAAMHLWSIVGNEGNRAHAVLLLAHVYALLGHTGEASSYHATSSAYFLAGSAEAWEIALIHAVAANVASCAGDAAAHHEHYRTSQELIRALPDPEDREILLATLRVVPVPAQSKESGGA